MPYVHKNEEAALVDVSTEGVVYEGYPAIGNPAQNSASWAIRRIKTGSVIQKEWAFGSTQKSFKWSERADLTYKNLV